MSTVMLEADVVGVGVLMMFLIIDMKLETFHTKGTYPLACHECQVVLEVERQRLTTGTLLELRKKVSFVMSSFRLVQQMKRKDLVKEQDAHVVEVGRLQPDCMACEN